MSQTFEFDDAKSAANKHKHSIDFVEAQRLWADDNVLIVQTRFVGEDLSEYLDWSKARRPNFEAKRVNVDFPLWVVSGLDREAQRLGVTRQSLIKMWIAEKLS